jgi:hypothetical protein
MHEQLGAARESAGELERGLSERLQRLDGLPDPSRDRAEFDRRAAGLDALAARLETLAGQAPAAADTGRLDAALARFDALATRIESAQAAERSIGGQDELAHLYDRILELAESLNHRQPVDLSDSAFARDAGARLVRISQQLEGLQAGLQDLGVSADAPSSGEQLSRIERAAARLERLSSGPGSGREVTQLLNRFESLANRLEHVPVALPELPSDAVAAPSPETTRALEELRVGLLCEQESRRRVEAELDASREKLRSSELARIELDTRHTAELTQMADHVGRQLQKVEEDLKKKKRGLAELTQQNITLQSQLARVQGGAPPGAEPPPPLPRTGVRPRPKLAPDPGQEGPPRGAG